LTLQGQKQAMIGLEHPPVCIIDWAKPGEIRQVSSVEMALVLRRIRSIKAAQ
jgi:hypothetical protein